MQIGKMIMAAGTACLLGAVSMMFVSASQPVGAADRLDLEDIQLPTNADGTLKVPSAETMYEFTLKEDGTYELSKYIYENDSSSIFTPEKLNLTLPSVYQGKPVTSIGDRAFLVKSADEIKSIVIPSGITSIGEAAFWRCENLSELTIPDTVTDIGDEAFDYTPWLETMRAQNPLVIVNGFVIDGKNVSGEVVIPAGVTTICGYAFHENAAITNVIIPDTVKCIRNSAFESCTGLTSICIPDSVTELGKWVFAYCENLTGTITIPGSIQRVPMFAFMGCKKVTEFVIQDGVAEIEKSAFRICMALERINIPDTVTSIDDWAFTEDHTLKTIVIPASVTYIGKGCFEYDYSLKSITIQNPRCQVYDAAETIPSYTDIYGYSGSDSQAYAKKYGQEFQAIGTFFVGDLDENQQSNASDAAMALIAAAKAGADGVSGLTAQQVLAGDVNADGNVNASDAALILQYAAAHGAGYAGTMADYMLEN